MRKINPIITIPINLDERFKGTPVIVFIPDFNLLSFEVDNFTLKCYI